MDILTNSITKRFLSSIYGRVTREEQLHRIFICVSKSAPESTNLYTRLICRYWNLPYSRGGSLFALYSESILCSPKGLGFDTKSPRQQLVSPRLCKLDPNL